MIEVAEILRSHADTYLDKYQNRMPQNHVKVIQAILECRTAVMGGHLYHCDKCDKDHYSYHSCKNRHCPKCQRDENQEWLVKQLELLLPVTYFMVTFTLPAEFRALARSNQRLIYNIFFKSSSAALQKLSLDPRFIGGKIGMIGILQTWTRDLFYHPHIHYIVPGGGLSEDGKQWFSARDNFLLPVKALSVIFRAKFRDALQKADPKLFEQIPPHSWKKYWVAHSEAVGSGQYALKYLSEYLFRVAISNHRIVDHQDDQVTFRYSRSDPSSGKDPDSKEQHYQTLTAEEFIRRFLQHVLPHRFVKVRYYGLLSPKNRPLLQNTQQLLGVTLKNKEKKESSDSTSKEKTIPCPVCKSPMKLVKKIPPYSRPPPDSIFSQQLLFSFSPERQSAGGFILIQGRSPGGKNIAVS
ncbi:MAG: IS91 family transposase, partial [Calditrichia bacterium]